ncbi:MAG: sulfatase-like hydrolase/transferase [Planctomycetota bacterium]
MRVLRLLAVVCALGAIAAAWWTAGPVARDGRPAAKGRVPGVVVLCFDTLRADATHGPAGAAALPTFAAFGASATRFPGALASCSWTGPSVGTLLTGLSPWNHGVFEVTSTTRLAASVPTLASILRAAGWSTAAVTGGGWLSEGCGLPAGFDQYDADFDELEPAAAVRRWERRRALDRPFLLFLHTYAAHDPYGDKRAFAEGRCDDAAREAGAALAARVGHGRLGDAPDVLRDFLRTYFADPCGRGALERALGAVRFEAAVVGTRPVIDGAWRTLGGGPAIVDELRAAYHGPGLAWVDARLRATLDALASLPPETVVVVCSDHGEAFGEHGPLYHGRFLTPELVRSVLMVRAPGWPARDVPGTVGLVDVTPTLLDLCGVAPARGVAFDGVSLVPRVRGTAGDRPVASGVVPPADPLGGPETYARRAAVRDARFAWSARYDVRQRAWGDEAWFDRAADPDERRPLAAPPAVDDAFARARDDLRRAFEARFGR